jgi:predicted RNA-binding protein with TRAM domain
MADCPLADDCPSFTERIEGMGCQYYGDRGGKEWCNHYSQPIEELKTAPVVPGEEVVVDVTDLHESGMGIGHTEGGFVVMVDGILPEARARVEVETVKPNYARGEVVERLPMEDDAEEDAEPEDEATEDDAEETDDRREQLGSRENFWGG